MNTFLKLLPYLRPYRRRLILTLGGTCVFTLLMVVQPLLMRYLVDKVVRPKAWELLPFVAIAIVLAPVLAAVLRFVNVRVLVQVSRRFIADMRLTMYDKILGLSMRYFGEKSSGTIVGRLMDDVNMLQRLLAGNTIQIVVDVIVFVFAFSVSLSISLKLWSVLCGVLVFYVLVYRFFSKRIRRATISYRAEYDRITGRLQETLSGVRQVRIYNREEWETEMFLDRTQKSLNKALESKLSSVSLSISCTAIAGYGSTIIMGLGAYFVLRGEMTYGDLLAFGSYVWMAINPAMHLTTMVGQLQETFVSAERILEVLSEPRDICSPPDAPRMKRGEGAVSFNDVWFSYTPDTPLYEGLSIDIKAGMTVALVGPTGCGKTTLTTLLMRYWDVQSGSICIDGVDIRHVNLKSLRDLFGVVLQTPVIFDMTFAENIAYGWPGAPREKIVEAAKAAEIHDMAMGLPQGYDTMIGTYGVKLSVGEKQRLNIARAILKDPLILIMDEATSALDSESEGLIQKALARILKRRTSFIIAHRLTTITGADLIVVMDNGRITDSGTHEQLMAKVSGMYRQLYMELAGASGGLE